MSVASYQEAEVGVEVVDRVLHGRAAQAPRPPRLEAPGRMGRQRGAVLDALRLVQDHPAPQRVEGQGM